MLFVVCYMWEAYKMYCMLWFVVNMMVIEHYMPYSYFHLLSVNMKLKYLEYVIT